MVRYTPDDEHYWVKYLSMFQAMYHRKQFVYIPN